MQLCVNFEGVKTGKNKNHLIFTGLIPYLSDYYRYTFDYIGTELSTTASMPDEWLEILREELKKDYGYAPFKISKAKKIFKDHYQYVVEV